MHAIVCVKQVPDTSDVKINRETNTLVREGVESIINPFDTYAIEEAIRLKEAHGGKVTVISMGPPQAMEALKEAVAMGCDEALLLSDRAFAGADTWATAYTLAKAIERVGDADIIFCGKQAIDGDTGQVGPGIARQLGITQLTYVFKIRMIDIESQVLEVERLLEEGREIVSSPLPAVVTVVKDINQPRYPTFKGLRRATRMQIPTWSADDIEGIDGKRIGLAGSPTQVVRIFTPSPRQGKADMIEADTVVQATNELADKLLAEKII